MLAEVVQSVGVEGDHAAVGQGFYEHGEEVVHVGVSA